MFLRLSESNVKLRGCDPAPLDLFDLKGRASAKRIEGRKDVLPRRAGIDQRADGHVSANPAEGIKVADTHAVIMWEVRRALLMSNVFSLYEGGGELPMSL